MEKEIIRILKQYITENPQSYLEKTITKYQLDTERKMVKNLLITPIRKGADDAIILRNYNLYKQRMKAGDCYLTAIKLKYKMALKLLEKRHLKLAKLLLWF